jgi:hypothetical protein
VALTPEVEEIVERSAERMRADWDEQLARLLVDWEPITQAQSQELQAQVRKLVDANDVEGLADLEVSTTKATDLLADYLTAMFEVGEDQIEQEAKEQGVTLAARWHPRNSAVGDDLTTLLGTAATIVSNLAKGLCSAVSRLVLRLWGTQPSGDAMATEVREFINGLSDRALRDELGGGLTNAMNRGRFSVLLRLNAATWYATERNDPNACSPCRQIDETQFATLAAAMTAYPSGGYKDCEGGVRCRGGVVPVWGQS